MGRIRNKNEWYLERLKTGSLNALMTANIWDTKINNLKIHGKDFETHEKKYNLSFFSSNFKESAVIFIK